MKTRQAVLVLILLVIYREAESGTSSNETNLFQTKAFNSSLPNCTLGKYCHAVNLQISLVINCVEFNSLDQLKHDNCQFDLAHVNHQPVYLQLWFPDNYVLSSGLPIISGLMKLLSQNNIDFYLYLTHIPKIDTSFFFQLTVSTNNLFTIPTVFEITRSEFNLFNGEQNLLLPENCNQDAYRSLIADDDSNVLSSFFGGFVLDNVALKNKMCPWMFHNLTIQAFQAGSTNLEFSENSLNETIELNSNIKSLSLGSFYHLELTTKIAHPAVFQEIQKLNIWRSSITSIQSDLFRNRFLNLRTIELQLINKKSFFHKKGGVEWMNYINYHIEPMNLTHRSRELIISLRENGTLLGLSCEKVSADGIARAEFFPYLEYQYPIEDFCLFIHVPFDRLVFPYLNDLQNESCTSKWLMQYSRFYSHLKGIIYINVIYNFSTIDCNYTELLDRCVVQDISSLYRYTVDPYFVFEYLSKGLNRAKHALVDIIGPVACVIGLIGNLLIVLTILYNHKRRNEIRTQPKNKSVEIVLLEQPLYKYILFNSCVNSVYLFMYLIQFTTSCSQQNTSFGYAQICFFKNVIVDTIGSFVKLLSNFSLLQISINRYILVGKDHSEKLVNLSKLTIKRFFLYSALISALLSVVIYFQKAFFVIETYSQDDKQLYYNIEGYHFYYWGYSIDDARHNFLTVKWRLDELPLLTAFTTIHDLFSYFLFCVISILVDALTIKKLHDALLEKTKLKGKQEKRKSRESERKSIMMVVVSSMSNIIFRAPELMSIIFYYTVTHDGGYVFKMLCWTYKSCLVFVDLANVFYITSLCFSFFIYIKFNSIFRCSFDILTKMVLNRNSQQK